MCVFKKGLFGRERSELKEAVDRVIKVMSTGKCFTVDGMAWT